MSSTGQAISSTPNVLLIIDALADYAKITGIDLSKNSFAVTLRQSSSPEASLQILEGRETAFKEYREGNRRLIRCLSPTVKVLQAFSGILGEAVKLVSVPYGSYLSSDLLSRSLQIPFPPASALFAGIDTLLNVRLLNMTFD